MSNLILYHGTIATFDRVDLEHTKHNKDFGRGFYTTTSSKQAFAWAQRMASIYNKDISYVYSFMILKSEMKSLNICDLDKDMMQWLQVVYTYRLGLPALSEVCDVITGKVADAKAQSVIDTVLRTYGNIDFYSIPEQVRYRLIEDLKPNRLSDQYCFKTEHAIQVLNSRAFKRKEIINGRIKG